MQQLRLSLLGDGVVAGMAQKQDNLFLLQAEKFADLAESQERLWQSLGAIERRMDKGEEFRLAYLAEAEKDMQARKRRMEELTELENKRWAQIFALVRATGDAVAGEIKGLREGLAEPTYTETMRSLRQTRFALETAAAGQQATFGMLQKLLAPKHKKPARSGRSKRRAVKKGR